MFYLSKPNAFPYPIWNLKFPNIVLALTKQSSQISGAIKNPATFNLISSPLKLYFFFPTLTYEEAQSFPYTLLLINLRNKSPAFLH